MNDNDFPRNGDLAQRIRHLLNASCEAIDRPTADRLFQARQKALARHRPSARLGIAGHGGFSIDLILPLARTVVLLVGVVLGVAGVSFWNSVEKAAELGEVDVALLSDDLPVDAYLDRGFDVWLQHSSQQ